MDERTPRRIKIGMAVIVVAAIIIAVLNAYSRGYLW